MNFHNLKRQVLCFGDRASNCPGFARAPRQQSRGSHIHALSLSHRHIQAHRSTQVRTETLRVQAHISTQVRTEIQRVQAHISTQVRTETQRVQRFSHEHNIQVVLASHRGRGRASISAVEGAMLQSLIAIDSLPSDLSGPEVVAIFWDLALTAHTQEVLMRSV